MKSLDAKVLTNITPDRMAYIRQQAQIRGMDLHGKHGTFKYDGCSVEYTYDNEAQTLTLQANIPFYATDEQWNGHLHDVLGTGDLPATGATEKPHDAHADSSEVHNQHSHAKTARH